MQTSSEQTSYTGPLGTATKLDGFKPIRPDQEATVAAWFLQIPGAHPLWSCYMLSVVHLREIAGVKPAVKRFNNATHELLVIALNPNLKPRPDDRNTWQHMTPINVVEQFEVGDDDAAAAIAEKFARACVDGHLHVEPQGIYGERVLWTHAVERTAEHMRLGGHPQAPRWGEEVSH